MTTNQESRGKADEDVEKWEVAVITIEMNADFIGALNNAGQEGWRPWGVLNAANGKINIGLTRPAKKVKLASVSDMKDAQREAAKNGIILVP